MESFSKPPKLSRHIIMVIRRQARIPYATLVKRGSQTVYAYSTTIPWGVRFSWLKNAYSRPRDFDP